MNRELSENIAFLIYEGKKIKNITIGMLFSYKRNQFFAYLGKYIGLYNTVRVKVLEGNKKIDQNQIPELHFEDYSLWFVTHFFLMFFLPFTFPIFILQWNYIREVKKKLSKGLEVFEGLLDK